MSKNVLQTKAALFALLNPCNERSMGKYYRTTWGWYSKQACLPLESWKCLALKVMEARSIDFHKSHLQDWGMNICSMLKQVSAKGWHLLNPVRMCWTLKKKWLKLPTGLFIWRCLSHWMLSHWQTGLGALALKSAIIQAMCMVLKIFCFLSSNTGFQWIMQTSEAQPEGISTTNNARSFQLS